MTSDTLQEYKTRRELWVNCLGSDDPHSIMQQIFWMVWNVGAFRVINEARRITPRDNQGGVQLNALVHQLIDHSFFESQMLAIRRLTDTYPLTGDPRKRDVFSLTSLLQDMRNHAHLMTRANMFAAEGLQYDYEAVRHKQIEYFRAPPTGRGSWVPPELDWERLQERHQHIDLLAGVTPENRSPTDSVEPEILGHLNRNVKGACKDVHFYVNKFVAHAATPQTRQAVNADNVAITLKQLWHAHEAICKVAAFVSVYLLTGTAYPFLPVPQYDQFAYIDRPLVGTENIPALREAWRSYEEETNKWSAWTVEEFLEEYEASCPDDEHPE